MDFGAHLPLIDFEGDGYSLDRLVAYAEAARDLGFAAVSANDHLLFPGSWLDGPVALATVLPSTGTMGLMTSVALPVVRGPLQTAKTLGAIDVLSGGRLIMGVGPGSSAADYAAVGIDFETRWKRFDDAVPALRALWLGDSHRGAYYSTDGMRLQPRRSNGDAPPIWIGSWGSEAGLRRTARLGDGWLASAYNTTPDGFRTARDRLNKLLLARQRDATNFPNALGTMWTYITDSGAAASRIIDGGLAKMLNRDPVQLGAKLLVGSPEHCARILNAYREAGVQRVLIWPVAEYADQLEIFKKRVEPLVHA